MARQQLSDVEVQRALGSLAGWARKGNALIKQFQHKDFVAALSFVNRVGEEAERRNHHPDIDIRYNKVQLSLSTHDAGGITQADLDLAAAIERL